MASTELPVFSQGHPLRPAMDCHSIHVLAASWATRGRGRRVNATGKKRAEPRLINILQWNAEGVYNKKVSLMDTAHILQDCPLQDILRLAVWPEETPLREKLYGDLAALKKMASLVGATGVDI